MLREDAEGPQKRKITAEELQELESSRRAKDFLRSVGLIFLELLLVSSVMAFVAHQMFGADEVAGTIARWVGGG